MRAPSPPLKAEALEHLTWARHNYRLYQRLQETNEYQDWALTLLFYVVVHLVQAHARQHSRECPIGHGERRDYVRRRLDPIYLIYRDFQIRSEDVRYDLWMPSRQEVEAWHTGQFTRIVAYLAAPARGIRLHE